MRSAKSWRSFLLVWCLAMAGPSAALEVITTLIMPLSRSSLCQLGCTATMASYSSTAMRRDMHTIMPLPWPALATKRALKCSTMSLATACMRSGAPNRFSTRVHLARCTWVLSKLSSSNSSSNSFSFCSPSSLMRTLAKRPS